jgi:accessory gene regulator protein AgrB
MNENEAENSMNLANARKTIKQKKSTIGQTKLALSFGKKILKYWKILLVSAVADLFGSVPVLSVIMNLGFGFILFFYFGSKKTKNPSANLLGIVLPELLGSVFDWILSVLPVNIGTALIRIALSDDTE